MDVVYLLEVDVHKRCSLMKKPYAAHERLCGVDRHLLHFLSKTELLSDQLRVSSRADMCDEEVLFVQEYKLCYSIILYSIRYECGCIT